MIDKSLPKSLYHIITISTIMNNSEQPSHCSIEGCNYEMQVGDSYTEHLAENHPWVYRHVMFMSQPKSVQKRIVNNTFKFFENREDETI